MDNYMTAEELRGVAEYCDALAPLWGALVSSTPKGGISVEEKGYLDLSVSDSNGEILGSIKWADSGPAFYPGEDKD